jgi:hypothetical protein
MAGAKMLIDFPSWKSAIYESPLSDAGFLSKGINLHQPVAVSVDFVISFQRLHLPGLFGLGECFQRFPVRDAGIVRHQSPRGLPYTGLPLAGYFPTLAAPIPFLGQAKFQLQHDVRHFGALL